MQKSWFRCNRVCASLALGGLLLTGCGQDADEKESRTTAQGGLDAGALYPGAPPETAQFGQLVGVWRARQVSRKNDGSWSDDTTTAEWVWRYVLDGHAIQDEWIVPPLSDTASSRFRGINIRMYDPEQQAWQIAWIDTRGRKFSLFTAVTDSARIIMTGVDARGRPARNIFSEITPVSFSWTKEWTFDQGRTWIPVSRIRCSKKN